MTKFAETYKCYNFIDQEFINKHSQYTKKFFINALDKIQINIYHV